MPQGLAGERRPTTPPAENKAIRAMYTSRARATKSRLAFAAPLTIAEACATMAKAGGTAGAGRGGHGKVELCRPAAQFDHTDAHSCGRGRHPFCGVERRTRPIGFAGTDRKSVV